ncbi:MAG: hypothetical protein Q7R96_01390 [Nanoarchaeota archaeon]|nr:hypothetical protein [Nanoarchaeota archaeon]
MSLKNKLATAAIGVGGAVALAGLGSAVYNGFKYDTVQDEAIARINGTDRRGPVFVANGERFNLSRPISRRTAAEIDSDSLRYRSNSLMGLGALVGGLYLLGAGWLKKNNYTIRL